MYLPNFVDAGRSTVIDIFNIYIYMMLSLFFTFECRSLDASVSCVLC